MRMFPGTGANQIKPKPTTMRNYIKNLIPQYLDGTKISGNSPKRYSDYYGRHLTAMSYNGERLYSYDTLVGLVDRNYKILYLTDKKYSATTSRQINDTDMCAYNHGYHVVYVAPEILNQVGNGTLRLEHLTYLANVETAC